MDRKALKGVELAYEIAGSGDPLVLIHASVCADFFAPLADEVALAERFRVLRYHRPGYGDSLALAGRSRSAITRHTARGSSTSSSSAPRTWSATRRAR
jgi:pimeloyl-ACP methyl ester carboxylesterase